MSGWNEKKRVFELTKAKANYWLRRSDLGLADWRTRAWLELDFFADLFVREGVPVCNRGSYLEVGCDPGRLWEILSGEPNRRRRGE